ncbi:MAG TPA: prolyl oligopeptidase family serine peptidase [Candidatus Sulfotelmatobacter sp.]|nr:prolyl oligopeptidase family serine peptidase [Candidatus Sulfotelmatobacter sp.]
MPQLAMAPPHSPIEPVTEVLHGVTITDPYRWLEDQDSPRTREWLAAQREYARSYLDAIHGRDCIRNRIRELLDVENYDSIQKVGQRYFFRKRLPRQEQPCIYLREGSEGTDHLLIDPAERGTGPFTAVKPLRVSPDGQLLLYEVKEGGERTGTFEILAIETRTALAEVLPRGYLRGCAFAPDSKSFYYVHEPLNALRPNYRAAGHHVLGTRFEDDQEIFCAGEDQPLRLQIVPGTRHLGFLVLHFDDETLTDFFLWSIGSGHAPEPVIRRAEYKFGPLLLPDGRILAITDRSAPNFKIVEVRMRRDQEPEFVDVVPESDAVIQDWAVVAEQIFVSYSRKLKTEVHIFDLAGRRLGQMPVDGSSTVRLTGGVECTDELLFERESFTQPTETCRYSPTSRRVNLWAKRVVPFNSRDFAHTQVWFAAKDETHVPMYLVARRDVLEGGSHPTIMTSYGGYGVAMTPQFSVFVAFLMERGCIFALPNIRGGSEFGTQWHEAARRRNRQVAFDDFLCAAQCLTETGRTEPGRLAIFGGSNSGLLVGAAITQRPDLFGAVVCMVPILDMLRYHLFDSAHAWKEEYGTVEDREDFSALLAYSPYHNVRDHTAYPAAMIVSGESDQNCNPMHARKMTARLQAANICENPIFLDYNRQRGHSPVLPLNTRIEALTDRMAFLCDQLGLSV